MTGPLQQFDWKSSQYERPTRNWVCGRLCEGTPCDFGPTNRGECQVQSTCTPEKVGDRFQCTRAAVHGGKCQNGPGPDGRCSEPDAHCQPHRSLFHKRRFAVVVCLGLSLAFCLVVFGSAAPSSLISPGDVTLQHSSVDHDCANCHAAAAGGFSHWAGNALDSEVALSDSGRCLKCHVDLGHNPLNAHGLSPKHLAEMTQRLQQSDESSQRHGLLALARLAPVREPNQPLACAACHHEHRGRTFDLTKMSSLQCQSCHVRQFESFAHGHPSLGNYPYLRRTRIYFDHARHLHQYFQDKDFKRLMPDGKSPASCSACHELDVAGRQMLTLGFDRTCNKCHADEIVDRDFPGLPFFALPAFTVPAAPDAGGEAAPADADESAIAIGDWPTNPGATAVTAIPPFLQLLLADDPGYQAAVKTLGPDAFSHLDRARQAHPAAVAKYLWSIKKLMHAVVEHGDKELERRLGPNQKELARLQPSILESLLNVQRRWFPNLKSDVESHEQGQSPASKRQPVSTAGAAIVSAAEHSGSGG